MRRRWNALDRWWFGYGSPTTLGMIRMLMGGLILVNLLMLATSYDSWFSERGFFPIDQAQRFYPPVEAAFQFGPWTLSLPFDVPRFTLLTFTPSYAYGVLFYLLLVVAALFTCLGLWSRVSTIALAVGIVSLHHRNPAILHGGDTVMRVMALYLAIAPSGAACSLDRLIALWKGRVTGPPKLVSMWPQRLIAVNVAVVYFTTFWHKVGFGTYWQDGTATWYTARLNEFDKLPVPDFMKEFPMVTVQTYGTLAVELALGTLVFWKPARKWVLLLGILMHGYIEWSMNIPLFAFLMCALYVAFYDGEEVEAWAKRLGERLAKFRLIARLPAGHRLQPGPEGALLAADPLGLVEYQAGQETGVSRTLRAAWIRTLGLAWAGPLVWGYLLRRALVAAPPEEPKRKGAKPKPEATLT